MLLETGLAIHISREKDAFFEAEFFLAPLTGSFT